MNKRQEVSSVMDEEKVKALFRDWMYNWGYYPKGFSFHFIKLDGILQKGKAMVPFYTQKEFEIGSRNYIILDDLFELQVYKKAQKSPFNFKEGIIPKEIAFEYKGNGHGMREIYTAIGQVMVYYYTINQPMYLIIDIKDYLTLEKVFGMLPYGIICYRVKSIDDGIKVFKHPNVFPI